jgi:hypothetical protein
MACSKAAGSCFKIAACRPSSQPSVRGDQRAINHVKRWARAMPSMAPGMSNEPGLLSKATFSTRSGSAHARASA